MRQIQIWMLAGLLAAIGIGLFFYKWQKLEFPLTADKTYNSWYIEAHVDVTARNRTAANAPVELDLRLPQPNSKYALVDENFMARGYGGEVVESDEETGNRHATFSKRRLGSKDSLYYRAVVYEVNSPVASANNDDNEPVSASPYSKSNRVRKEAEEQAEETPLYEAIDSLHEQAESTSATPRTLVHELIKLATHASDERIQLIREAVNPRMTQTELAALLVEARGYPVRLANGIYLVNDQRNAPVVPWLEVYIEGKWLEVDPQNYTFGIKKPHLVWWYGKDAVLLSGNKVKSEVKISVRQNTNNALTRAIWKSGQFSDVLLKFSFFNLPLDTQLVFQVLLMIPIGALVVSVIRQIIGIDTFGTFMPVLIALAFRETGLGHGIIFFGVIVMIGLIIRAYFDRLQLLMVPRLGSLLTIVVMLLGALALIANSLGITTGLSISLFPIVILTMTIERMSLLWEESGSKTAIRTGVNSVFAAVLSYYAMNYDLLEHLIFTFPELLLLVLATNIVLGRYNGYKLTEYMRFRALRHTLDAKNMPPANPPTAGTM